MYFIKNNSYFRYNYLILLVKTKQNQQIQISHFKKQR